MRQFSSYGPIDIEQNYYVPRTDLIDAAHRKLVGDDPTRGGHYITIWAPRQTGKTWIMQQVARRLQEEGEFEVGILTLQLAKDVEDETAVLEVLVNGLRGWFNRDFPVIKTWRDLPSLFTSTYFERPVVLILDEFDALAEPLINMFANVFRSMHTERANQIDRPSTERANLLHGLALIGVRSVLGLENRSGSPFNVQQSLHIPNLTADEVNHMFQWYSQESGQAIEQAVIDQVLYETQGQPGLVSWLGELLTTTYNTDPQQPIGMKQFQRTYTSAIKLLPNNNIVNIVSKAKDPLYTPIVLELFKTDNEMEFAFDNPQLNYLYLNGIIVPDDVDELHVKFASPFVQKRLFNYFTTLIFPDPSRLYDPFTDLSAIITETSLDVGGIIQLYESYVHENRNWLFKSAPVRQIDGRIYEAVYHFNFFAYLSQFMRSYDGHVLPEFPTGNGKIDLLIQHAGQQFGLELKSFVNQRQYDIACQRAAEYADQLALSEIWLIFFIDLIDDANRRKFEVDRSISVGSNPSTAVTVHPRFVVVNET